MMTLKYSHPIHESPHSDDPVCAGSCEDNIFVLLVIVLVTECS